jgi:hypothetical protein
MISDSYLSHRCPGFSLLCATPAALIGQCGHIWPDDLPFRPDRCLNHSTYCKPSDRSCRTWSSETVESRWTCGNSPLQTAIKRLCRCTKLKSYEYRYNDTRHPTPYTRDPAPLKPALFIEPTILSSHGVWKQVLRRSCSILPIIRTTWQKIHGLLNSVPKLA